MPEVSSFFVPRREKAISGTLVKGLGYVGVDLWQLQRELDELLSTKVDRERFDKVIQKGGWEEIAASGIMPILTRAMDESLQLHHNYTGTEHLLLALFRSPHSDLSCVFARHGLSYDAIKESIIVILKPEE
jgi:ATP-dependent Clp protease ATP-binding subunit ClpA